MINNRQGGRRRGRGGQRPQNLGGRPDGNRQDNRQRGNAAQLLEKYKSMARDAQLGGDRVQTEYYLQYADHYYRVLGESRARFEEQRRTRGDGSDEDEGDDEQMDGGDEQRLADDRDDERPEPRESRERFDRDRPEPRESRERFERPDRPERNVRPERNQRDERPQRVQRLSRDGGNGEDSSESGDGESPRGGGLESIAFDALPPAIGRGDVAEPAEEAKAPAPKRRVRKARAADDEGDVAPAA